MFLVSLIQLQQISLGSKLEWKMFVQQQFILKHTSVFFLIFMTAVMKTSPGGQ